ncbi:glycosyltransferase [Candidatus Woesearchaeota archaeon]|nr:glycosyltransferase [Candidatus Woesearchaeota archaeon]
MNKTTVGPHLDISVVTITYNERENIREVIVIVNKIFQNHSLVGEIIVVDDSSPDGTADVVLELKKEYPNTTLLKRPAKMGVGSAYRDGLALAKGEIVIPLDADLSHSPEVIPEMCRIAKEGKIGWGSRYLGNTRFETDFPHKVGTFLLNRWVSTVLNTKVLDNSMGYFAMKRELLNRLLNHGKEKNIYPFGRILYGIPLAALAQQLQIPITEVKTHYNRRKYGKTKIPFLRGLKTVLGDMGYALELRNRLRR